MGGADPSDHEQVMACWRDTYLLLLRIERRVMYLTWIIAAIALIALFK